MMLIHPLESRLLLADMSITATSGNDVVSLKQTNTSPTAATIEVSNGGTASIVVKVGTISTTLLKATKKSFTSIGRITLADLGKGDDKFTADKSVKIPMSVSGGDGKDTITGGTGADVLSGDKATGTAFNDSVNGGAGNDTIYGYAGNDELFGNDGSDSIRGGTGNDTINGGINPDKLFGEDGNDAFTCADGAKDTVDGGAGSDSADRGESDVFTRVEASSVVFQRDNPDGTICAINGTSAADTMEASVDSNGVLTVKVNGSTFQYDRAARLAFLISVGLDKSFAESVVNRIQLLGGAGNDTITAGAGIEGAYGERGNDTLKNTSKAFLAGNSGNDKLTNASSNNLRMFGDEFLLGFDEEGIDGNDTITGGSGKDSIDGGFGADSISGGGGFDTVDYSSRSESLVLSLDGKNNDGEFGEGDNLASDIECLLAGSGNDKITGNDLRNVFAGGDGNDTLLGNGGNDDLFGDDGDDSIRGGGGTDKASKPTGSGDVVFEVETLV